MCMRGLSLPVSLETRWAGIFPLTGPSLPVCWWHHTLGGSVCMHLITPVRSLGWWWELPEMLAVCPSALTSMQPELYNWALVRSLWQLNEFFTASTECCCARRDLRTRSSYVAQGNYSSTLLYSSVTWVSLATHTQSVYRTSSWGAFLSSKWSVDSQRRRRDDLVWWEIWGSVANFLEEGGMGESCLERGSKEDNRKIQWSPGNLWEGKEGWVEDEKERGYPTGINRAEVWGVRMYVCWSD